MDAGEEASTSLNSTDQTIELGHTILLRVPSGDIRTVKLEKDSYVNRLYYSCQLLTHLSSRNINLGRFGTFFSNELIGEPYGRSYDIEAKKLKLAPPKVIQEVGTRLLTCSVY